MAANDSHHSAIFHHFLCHQAMSLPPSYPSAIIAPQQPHGDASCSFSIQGWNTSSDGPHLVSELAACFPTEAFLVLQKPWSMPW